MAKKPTDGSITRLRNGRFWVRGPLRSDGKRPGLGTFATLEEAEKHLETALYLSQNAAALGIGKVPFAKFGREVFDLREEEGVRGVDKERARFECHLAESPIAEIPLSDVTPQDVAELVRHLGRKEAADRRGKRRIKRRTVQRCISLVSIVFREAVMRGLATSNPCTGIEVRKRADEDTQETWTFLNPDEQRALATCAEIPEADRIVIRFAMATGIRQGELCHAMLSDLHVDGEEPYLFVRYGSKGKAPKNGKTRRVPLFGDGLAAAREWLALRPTYVRPTNRHGVQPDEGVVFPTPTGARRQPGKPLGNGVRDPSGKWVDRFKHCCTIAGVALRPGLHWHALRHTCATSLLEGWLGRAWALEEVKEMLGHSSVAVTQRYAHHAGTRLRAAARETAGAGYALVTVGGSESRNPLSHLRDLNSRPTVYECNTHVKSLARIDTKDAPFSPEHNQTTIETLAATFLDLVRRGQGAAALAVGVSLASAVISTEVVPVQVGSGS